jgi:hypothetical protein
VAATAAVLVTCVAVPATSGAQPVPRKAHYIGETRPGTGVVEVTVRKRRVVDVQIDHRFWRCSGPGADRQEMGWDLEVFSPGSPRLRVGGDGRFAYRHRSGGRETFSRFAITGRFSAQGRRVAGTFRWHNRGITQRGAVECRSPLIRYSAWVSVREFAGETSQGVPVRADLKWTFDLKRWMTGERPPYIEGVFTPITGLSPAPPPFAVVLLSCPDGSVQEEAISARADPSTGQLSAPPVPIEPGEQLVVSGRASPLATAGPASVSLAITVTRQSGSGDGSCTGSATFEATELAPLAP